MADIGIFFGSTDGNTERVCGRLQEIFGEDKADLVNVNGATGDDMEPYSSLILACPTWEIGELQEDWESFIDELDNVDMSAKKIAYLGLGDADGYPDTFLDAPGIIHDKIKDTGASFVGAWPTDDYEYEASKAEINEGEFLCLGIDEDNEAEKTEERLQAWAELLQKDFS